MFTQTIAIAVKKGPEPDEHKNSQDSVLRIFFLEEQVFGPDEFCNF